MKILFFLAAAAYAGQISYLDVLERLGSPMGDRTKGEIEIVVEPENIEKIEAFQKQQLIQKGCSEKDAANFSKVGIVAQDQYWMWIRDAVIFPNGTPGTYERLIWKNRLHSKYSGIAILPILPDGRIALNLNYRHATRSWEIEIPRGGIKMGESCEQAALRELKEETGLIPASIECLGEMAPDSGVLEGTVPIYIAYGSQEGLSNIEYSEAIAGTLAFTLDEIQKGFIQGYLMVNGQKVPVRDPFLAFALLKRDLLQK